MSLHTVMGPTAHDRASLGISAAERVILRGGVTVECLVRISNEQFGARGSFPTIMRIGVDRRPQNCGGSLNGRPEWTRTIDLFRVKEAL